MIGKAIGAVGNLLDLPGSSVRDALAMRNPFDQYLSPLSDVNRTSGRDLARHYGLASNKDTWGNFAGGLAAEALLDPTNLIGAGLIGKGLKSVSKVKSINKGIATANALSKSQRAMGFMPEEVARLSKIVDPQTGMPQRLFHGTNANVTRFDDLRLSHSGSSTDSGWYGRGIYSTPQPHLANEYAVSPGGKVLDWMEPNVGSRVLSGFADIRNPYLSQSLGDPAGFFESMPAAAKKHVSDIWSRGNTTKLPWEMSKEISDSLRSLGYDGAVVTGKPGSYGNLAEVVAYEDGRLYSPYIAPAIRPALPLPALPVRLGAGLAAHNAVARPTTRRRGLPGGR